MVVDSDPRRRLLRWVLALGAAELGARALLALTGTVVAAAVGPGDPERAELFLGASMLFVGVLEGVMVGLAERWALGAALAPRRARLFVAASGLAFGLVWLGGSLASGAEPATPSAAAVFAVAALMGALLGATLGVCQSLALGRLSSSWVAVSALAWASGMLVGAMISQLVPDGAFTVDVLGLEALSGALTGVVVALSSGAAAERLSRSAPPSSDGGARGS